MRRLRNLSMDPGLRRDDGLRANLSMSCVQLAAEYPASNAGKSAVLTPLHEMAVANVRGSLGILLAAVQRDVQPRVQLLELAQELREHDPARAGRGADLERPRERRRTLHLDVCQQLLLERQDPLRSAIEPRAGLNLRRGTRLGG